MTTPKFRTLKFTDGATQFRLRLTTSLLSHRPLLLTNIRSDDLDAPGLHEHEASFLRLIDRMTNGTKIEINATGTQLRFKPGVLLGGSVEHDCPIGEDARSVSWYLEDNAVGSEPLELTLNGITDGTSDVDPSADYLSASFLPLYIKFGLGSNDDLPPPSIRVARRGAAPLGQGKVHFYCPIVKELNPIDLVEFGKVKRVRGNAISCRIPPSSAARVAHSAKGVMHRLLPDVWIHTDVHSSSGKRQKGVGGIVGGGCGPSPGLSVILTATTTEGICLSAECSMSHNVDSNRHGVQKQQQQIERKKIELPEDLGKRSATMLLHEIFCGGCVDTNAQTFALLMMCLTPEDVSRIRLGPLSSYSVVSLRLFKEAFGVEFKLRVDEETKSGDDSDEDDEDSMRSRTVLCSCLGVGYRNMARAST
eukprot:CCRYP_009471-RA/>CCRYP_009471-RA protein AED:0.34 eAED:0.34 QI:0/0/0/1/1/1/2/0/419